MALDHFIKSQTKKWVRLLIHCSGLLVLVALQKSRTYDTLVLTRVSIALQKVGLLIRWTRLVYRFSYKKLVLRCTALEHRIDSPT